MDLNDDCLLLIFKLLKLKDQIAVALACPHFRVLLSYLWQKTYVSLSLNFGIDEITVKEFAVLIKGICGTIQQMRLRDLNFERLTVLKLYTYPNLTSFSFTQWSRFPLNDDNMLDMTRIFPKLRSFSPHGPFSGKHMENWRNLQFLNLTYCANVKFAHLEKIFEILQLKSVQLNVFYRHHKWISERGFKNFTGLESIFLNSTELAWLKELSKFENLKELTIADREEKDQINEFLTNLYEHKRNDLIGLETNLNFPFYEPQISKFINLRRLIILSQDITEYKSICNYANNLRELIFKCCELSTSSAADLIFLINQSVQVEHISVEQCKFGFRDFQLNARDLAEHRTKRLHFNFYENTFIDNNSPAYMRFFLVTLKIQGSSPLLEVTNHISTAASFQPLWIHFQ